MLNKVDLYSVTKPKSHERKTSLEIVKLQCRGVVEVSEKGEPLYRYRNTIFALVSFSCFILAIPGAAFNAAIQTIEVDIGIGSTTSGLVVGIPEIVAAVGGFFLLIFGEKLHVKVIISVTLFCGGVHCILVSLCTQAWNFFVFLPISAASYFFLIITPVLLDHMAPNHQRGFRVQLMFMVGGLGLAVGYTLGAGTTEHWRIVQAICGIVLVLISLGNFLLMSRAGIPLVLHDGFEEPFLSVAKKLSGKRGYVISVMLVSGVWSPMAAWAVYFVKWVNERFYDGEDKETPGAILGIFIILGALYTVVGGWVLDKLVLRSKRKYGESDHRIRLNTTLRFLVIMYIPPVVVGPFVFLQDSVTLFWVLFKICFFFICASPFTQGHLWAARHEEQDLPGAAVLTLVYLVNQVADGLMTLFLGYLMDHTSYKTAFALPTIWTIVLFLVALGLYALRQKSLGYSFFSVHNNIFACDIAPNK